jgi:hypothetical protein
MTCRASANTEGNEPTTLELKAARLAARQGNAREASAFGENEGAEVEGAESALDTHRALPRT